MFFNPINRASETMEQAPHILRCLKVQRNTLEDLEQHFKYPHCFQRSPRAPTCLFRCGTFETLVCALSHGSKSCGSPCGLCVQTGRTHPKLGYQIQRVSCQASSFPLTLLNWNVEHLESSFVSCCLAKAQSRGEARERRNKVAHLGPAGCLNAMGKLVEATPRRRTGSVQGRQCCGMLGSCCCR